MSAVAAGTRERLLRSAQDLIKDGGYGAASVVAIAEGAGVAAGTLYRHWPSKGELFAELFRVVCDRELAAMAERDGVTGVTSNPSIFEKAIGSGDYDAALKRFVDRDDADPASLFERLRTSCAPFTTPRRAGTAMLAWRSRPIWPWTPTAR